MGAPRGPAAPGSVCPAASKRVDIRSAPPCPIHHPPGSTAPLRGAGKEVPRLLGSPRRMCPPHPVPGTSVTGVGGWRGISSLPWTCCVVWRDLLNLSGCQSSHLWQEVPRVAEAGDDENPGQNESSCQGHRGPAYDQRRGLAEVTATPPIPCVSRQAPRPSPGPSLPSTPLRPHLPGVSLRKGLLGWGLAGWAGQGTPPGTADLSQATEGRLGLWPFPREQNRPVLPPLSVHSTALGLLPESGPQAWNPRVQFSTREPGRAKGSPSHRGSRKQRSEPRASPAPPPTPCQINTGNLFEGDGPNVILCKRFKKFSPSP